MSVSNLIPIGLSTVLDHLQTHANGESLYKYVSVVSNDRSAVYDLRSDSITLHRRGRKNNRMRVNTGSLVLEKDFSSLITAEESDTELKLGFSNGDILTFRRES